MLAKRLGVSDTISHIFARDMKFEEISEEDARRFLDENCLSGYTTSSRNFCLRNHDSEIVAVASINEITEDRYEISQILDRSDLIVVDMISEFVNGIFGAVDSLNVLIAFSDNDKESGDRYRSSRFRFSNETGPRRIYLSKSDPCNDQYRCIVSEAYKYENEIFLTRSSPLRRLKDLKNLDTERYIETSLSHRTDDGEGYDLLYTSGFKKWKIERGDVL